MDRIILEKNHIVCGLPLDVQKAQSKDGSQRSNRNMRSRQGPPHMSRSNYDGGYNNYQQNTYNNPYEQMPDNGYNSNFDGGNDNGGSFGQGFVKKK